MVQGVAYSRDFRSKYQDSKRSLLLLAYFEFYVMPTDHGC